MTGNKMNKIITAVKCLGVFILGLMSIAVLAYCLAISISRQKWWRIACLTAFPFTVAIPVGATLMYSLEL
jgi:hypothetical protein